MKPEEMSHHIAATCNAAPVIPVLTVADVAHARPLAQALVDGGLPALEVTLRTAAALDAISEMAQIDGAIVGVGTALNAGHIADAKSAGATFAVSPGATPALVDAAQHHGLPLLPGAATASEAMKLAEMGFETLKLFPAEAVGGRGLLKSLAAPLPQIKFCPTGGVSLQNAPSYLELPNVVCVGGSWVCPADLINAQDWDGIRQLASDASKLSR